MELRPLILEKDGRPAFVILPYEEFTALRDALEDALDSLALREPKKRAVASGRIQWTK